MKFNDVKSSNISGEFYDPATRTLSIKFSSGAVHHFDNVPQDIVDEFRKAESKGKFFASKIRNSVFKSRPDPQNKK